MFRCRRCRTDHGCSHPCAAARGALAPPAPARAVDAKAEARLGVLKTEGAAGVDDLQDFTQKMVDSVFSFGELGFQEIETSRYLTNILRQQGFTIEEGISGIPTAWMATWGSGKPVISLGSDIDGIPTGSQKPGVAYHDAFFEGGPGHGEGHNSGMPLNITAAIVLKRIMQREKIQGTIKLWPGVAEELLATKAYYVRDGYFKDTDVVIFTHIGGNWGVNWGDGTSNGLVSVEYTFKGESAHSAGAPWRGPQRARRRDADGHRLELSPRAPAHSAAVAFRHHLRRQSAERGSPVGVHLVLLPRDRLPQHQTHVGNRRQHGQSGGADDRYDDDLARARIGVAAAHE